MTVNIRATGSGVSFASSPRTVPVGTFSAGDLFVLVVHLSSAVAPTSVPSGFTLVPGSWITTTNSIYVYTKVATGSESGNFSVSFPSGSGVLTLFTIYSSTGATLGVDGVDVAYNASDTNRVWPSVSPTQSAALLCCFGLMGGNIATTPDAAMTERLDNAAGQRNYLMTQTLSASGATGTRTATGTATTSVVTTIAFSELPPAPTAPSALTATAVSPSQINLAWTDNSSNEANFELERSPDGSTGWTLIASPAANATSYSNTGLTDNTTYYYRIRAVNFGGNSSYTSVASDTTDPAVVNLTADGIEGHAYLGEASMVPVIPLVATGIVGEADLPEAVLGQITPLEAVGSVGEAIIPTAVLTPYTALTADATVGLASVGEPEIGLSASLTAIPVEGYASMGAPTLGVIFPLGSSGLTAYAVLPFGEFQPLFNLTGDGFTAYGTIGSTSIFEYLLLQPLTTVGYAVMGSPSMVRHLRHNPLRTVVVTLEDREVIIRREDRQVDIPAENRSFTVEG